MRALLCSPSSPGRIALRDVAEPVPAIDEAVVAVHAVSLNRGEFRRLQWAPEGWRPGYDIAGIVAQAAADGSGPGAGTRVIGVRPEGAWAERVTVPTRRLAVLPDALAFEPASTIPVAGLTSLAALAHGGPLLGKRVLVTGAAGGVGRFAVQLAARMGAHVTGQVGSPERGVALDALGARRVVVDLGSDEAEYDFILESIGGEVLGAALPRLAMHGCAVLIGGSSDTPTTFDGLAFARKGPISIVGISLFRELERQGMGTPDLERLVALMAAGELDPQIDRVGSWRDMGDLLEALGARRIAGKAVAVID